MLGLLKLGQSISLGNLLQMCGASRNIEVVCIIEIAKHDPICLP